MPGTIIKVITQLRDKVDIPIIAGGLIETEKEAAEILKSGAFAISTGKEKLWGKK